MIWSYEITYLEGQERIYAEGLVVGNTEEECMKNLEKYYEKIVKVYCLDQIYECFGVTPAKYVPQYEY